MAALAPVDRVLLLWSLALNPDDEGRLDVETVGRILDQTPDEHVTELEDNLFVNNGQLLRMLGRGVKGNDDAQNLIDSAMRLWVRGELPEGAEDDGKARWMKGLMGDPVKMTRTQYDQMLASAPDTMKRQVDRVRGDISFDDANRAWRHNPIGDIVDAWGGLQKPPTAAELIASPEGFFRNPYGATDFANRLVGEGRYFEAGAQLNAARAMNTDLFRQWETYRGHSIDSGESLEEGIKVGAVTAIVIVTAGYAAPFVYGGSLVLIGGEGMTIATAGTGMKLGATALTTTALFTGGGFLGAGTRGGLDLATGQPVTQEELWKGAKTGAPAGATVGMGYGLNLAAGLGANAPLTVGNLAKSGFLVHGPTNATATMLSGTLEGHDAGRVAKDSLRDYGLGAFSGVVTTGAAPVLRGSPGTERVLQLGLGGGVPATGVWLGGGSDVDIQQAFLNGVAISFATSLAPEGKGTGKKGVPLEEVHGDIHDPPSGKRRPQLYDDYGPLVDWGPAPSAKELARTIDQTLAKSKVFGKWVGPKQAAGKSATALGVRVLPDDQFVQVRAKALEGKINPKTRQAFTEAERLDYARRSRGFTDETGLVTFPESKFEPGNEIHEGLHQLQSPEFRKLGRNISEGATEYFTMIVTQEQGVPRSYKKYQELRPPVYDMSRIAGFENVAEAYFKGDVSKVKAAFEGHKPGLWDDWVKLCREGKTSEARTLLEPYYE
jgi:hypothetical protein